jgi:6-phosphogluconolactonase
MQGNEVDVVIGSYSDGKVGPSVFYLKGAEHTAKAVLEEINPSYILRHEGYYYVVAEHQNGNIIALDKNFNVIAKVTTMGDDPCHLSIDGTGRFLVASNYSSGSAIIYKLINHKPAEIHSFIVHEGHSNNPDRQLSPHCHTSVFSEDNNILFIADLGTDVLYYYDFTPEKVTWNKEKSIKIEDAGPRTVIRGKPGSQLLYLTCELDNTVRVLSYKNGLQQIVAYKVSQNINNFPSEIQYFPNTVYVALRGDDKIMVFDEKEGNLTMNYSFKVGWFPRHFALAQNYLYVACQKGNLVQKYQISS